MPAFEMSLEKLREYKGCSPLPSDFNEYWHKAMAENEETGLNYTLTPACFKAKGTECYDLWFNGVGGARIHCKFLKPSGITEKIPAIAVFHGYMHNAGEWFLRLPYVLEGMAVIVMDCRGQGGLSEDVYKGSGPTVFGHIVRGVTDENPQNLYYRNVYLDAVKTVKILMSMNYIDSERIAVTGRSQGGALALAAAALVPQIKLCAPQYPFLCDFKRVVEMDLNQAAYEGLYYYFKKCDPRHLNEQEFFNRLGYIDIQNHTPNVKANVLWQTGLMDHLCPPSTQFAAYNKLISEKEMLLYPEHDHEQIEYANDEIFMFLGKL